MTGGVRVGTCSWTDKTMIQAWYPKRVHTAEQRLRYYAARFDTVEVDSTFYGLPRETVAAAWAQRTPPEFVFHVKAYGLMTGHEVDERSLHPELREFEHEVTDRGRVRHPSSEMVDRSFEIFRVALEPLRRAGKLGGILMQYPPYFTAHDEHRAENLSRITHAHEMLAPDRVLIEFRHPSWVAEDRIGDTMAFLADLGLSYVSVDAPQFPERSTMPPVAAATSDWAYVRMHGRNRETYFGKHESAADRFDYLYTAEQLREWEVPVRRLAEETATTFVMFNNCKYDYAPRNAREMAEILGDLVIPPTVPNGGQLDLGV